MLKSHVGMAMVVALHLLMVSSVPALATEESDTSGETEKESSTAKIIADLSALTETIETLREKPSDTIATNGGDMEAAILSAGAIGKAGASIAGQTQANAAYVVLGQDDTLSLDSYLAFEGEVYGIEAQLNAALGIAPSREPDESGGTGFVAAATGALSLLSSLLRSETEISSLSGGLDDDRLLALAVAGRLGGRGIVPSAVIVSGFKPGNAVYDKLDALAKLRSDLASNDEESDAKTAALAHYDEFISALTKADDKGALLLVSVLQGQVMASALQNKAKVIRVHIDKSGGTLLKRKNLAVALGASAIGVSGGLVASYSISDPGTGTVNVSGLVVCRTGVMPFKKVHQWDGSGTNCDPI